MHRQLITIDSFLSVIAFVPFVRDGGCWLQTSTSVPAIPARTEAPASATGHVMIAHVERVSPDHSAFIPVRRTSVDSTVTPVRRRHRYHYLRV